MLRAIQFGDGGVGNGCSLYTLVVIADRTPITIVNAREIIERSITRLRGVVTEVLDGGGRGETGRCTGPGSDCSLIR